jgi:hypothetical protein
MEFFEDVKCFREQLELSLADLVRELNDCFATVKPDENKKSKPS